MRVLHRIYDYDYEDMVISSYDVGFQGLGGGVKI